MLRRTFTVLAITLGAFAGATLAQEYPAKPVKFLVPFPPAGGTDVVTRASAQSIGSQRPNGYTLARGQASNLAINPSLYSKMPFDPLKDFSPAALVSSQPLIVVVSAASPWKSLADLVASSKRDSLNLASPGNGTVGHVPGGIFQRRARIKLD